jgi:integrase
MAWQVGVVLGQISGNQTGHINAVGTDQREWHELPTERLVFHSTRKWFITQCERSGVPEHFTASLVGHASARSENGLTYSIYSAGISDRQKREIVDAIKLPR